VKSMFEVTRGANTVKLHDGPYSFTEQNYYLQSPEYQVQVGDQIKVTCVWTNPGNTNVTFGESSTKEMCFVGMYRYPAASSGLFECSDGAGF
ncbi:MAG: hypothetical protein H0T65_22945, partial [Deltaproteobacteria bacterium]|nr:hypothetical protein [Deltaproteobacteria bacterium]